MFICSKNTPINNKIMKAHFPKKAAHGGRIIELEKKFGTELTDVSASMNPFVPDIKCTFDMKDIQYYPDDSYRALKEKIAEVFSRDADEICVGNGSAEIIRVYSKVMLDENSTYRIDYPTFEEYSLSAELAGAEKTCGDADVRFICNPNNPTGILKSKSEMLSILKECENKNTNLFADEAFMELAASDESLISAKSDNLFVMRSLTKCFSVPGIRFGFGFGNPSLIEKIETARTPWTVNAFAEKFASEALNHYDELKDSAEKITEERRYYIKELEKLNLSHSDSSVNYILIHLNRSAEKFCAELLKKGIIARDCTSFGLRESIRVSIQTHDINKKVIEAISECLH